MEAKPVTKKGSGERFPDKRVVATETAGTLRSGIPSDRRMSSGRKNRRSFSHSLREIPDAECRIAPYETIYIINLTADEAKKVLEATNDGAQSTFENSVACIGAAICQQGVKRQPGGAQSGCGGCTRGEIPDGALPRICISGCPSSCSGHQAAGARFQGAAKTVDGKPESAFKMFVGGSDKLGAAKFGEAGAVILRPAEILRGPRGKAVAAGT